MQPDRCAVARAGRRRRPTLPPPDGSCRSGRTARAAAGCDHARGRRVAACRWPAARTAARRRDPGPPRRVARTHRASTEASRPRGPMSRADPTMPRARCRTDPRAATGAAASTLGCSAPNAARVAARRVDRSTGGGGWSFMPSVWHVRPGDQRPRLTGGPAGARVVAIVHPGRGIAARRPAASAAGATHDRHRGPPRQRGRGRHARRQPGGRPPQQGCVRRGEGLPAARRHRPRRVLGRQRAPGVGVLPGPVGLHAGRVLGARDRRPGPGQLRHAAARHPDRADGAAHPRRRDRRARPGARRRRPGHRVRGARFGGGLARDDGPGRPLGAGARSSSTAARTGRSVGAPSGPTARSATASSTGATTTAPSRPAIGRSRSRPGRRRASACSRSTTASATSVSAT